MVVCHADPKLGKQRRGDRAVVVQAGAVGFLPARVFKGALGRAAGVTEDRSLVALRARKTETAAQTVLLGDVPIHLGVDLIGRLPERQESEIVVGLRGRDDFLIRGRKIGKDLPRYVVDPVGRNDIARKRCPSLSASILQTGSGVVDLVSRVAAEVARPSPVRNALEGIFV